MTPATALPPWEQVVYAALSEAATAGAVCPTNLDLEMLVGCSSGSVAPVLVKRLARKGLIVVHRYQRTRDVQIVATGKWTLRSPDRLTDSPHVPRGARRVGSTGIVESGGTYSIGKLEARL